MNQPLINILIRSHRPGMLKVSFQSVIGQGYLNVKPIIIAGNEYGDNFRYNLLCNNLKQGITDGWFFFLDDDDTIIPDALSKIAEHLTDPDELVICQMLRAGRPKPSDDLMDAKEIIRGFIGMPCFFLHSKHKDIADFVAKEDADYRLIKEVAGKLKTKFVKIPVVNSPKRSFGK